MSVCVTWDLNVAGGRTQATWLKVLTWQQGPGGFCRKTYHYTYILILFLSNVKLKAKLYWKNKIGTISLIFSRFPFFGSLFNVISVHFNTWEFPIFRLSWRLQVTILPLLSGSVLVIVHVTWSLAVGYGGSRGRSCHSHLLSL